MKLIVAGKTSVGKKRANNEDNYCVEEQAGLMVVCDGAGGHASGEVASKMAVDIIRDQLKIALMGSSKKLESSKISEKIIESINVANQAIAEASQRYPQNTGMATTCVVAVADEKNIIHGHVGDSRLYLYRNGELKQLTDDHTLVNEQVKRGLITPDQAEKSQYKNILTRALGVGTSVEIDISQAQILPGDMALLCTDGLTRMINDDIIKQILKENNDPQGICDKLVLLAEEAGGLDNITLVVAYFSKESWWEKIWKSEDK